MKRLAYCLVMAIFLAGSAGCAHKVSPATVTAIVSACPQPPELARPILAMQDIKPEDLKNLTKQQLVEKLIKNWSVSMLQLMGYVDYLEEIIEGYRVNSPEL